MYINWIIKDNGFLFIVICEKCGVVGIKYVFYFKLKRFCSFFCFRSFVIF